MSGEAAVIDVIVPAGVNRSDTAAAVRTAVAALVRDLDLPVPPQARVTVRPGERWTVLVNGTHCPIPDPTSSFRLRPEDGNRAAHTVRMNPALLLTDDVVAALIDGSEAVPTSDARPRPDRMPRLLRDLAQLGVRPGRLVTALSQRGDGDLLEAFEDAVRDASHALVVHVDAATHEIIDHETRTDWARLLSTGLAEELGLLIGPPVFTIDEDLPPHHMTVRLNDLTTEPLPCLEPDQLLVNDIPERLALLDVPGLEVTNPATGQPGTTVAATHRDSLDAGGLTTWTASGFLILVAAAVARRYAAALFHRDILAYAQRQLATSHPVLPHLVERAGGVTRVTRVLRRLLDEQIMIIDLPRILSALNLAMTAPAADPGGIVAAGPHRPLLPAAPEVGDPDEAALAETARTALAYPIARKFARGTDTLTVYLLDIEVEQRMLRPEPVSPDEWERLLDMITAELVHLPPTAMHPHLLTMAAIRSRLHALLAVTFPRMAVLSYEELPPSINIQPIARISPR